MDWKSPFIVYRISESGKLEQVYKAETLKDAKYWLTYIAEPGDVLCQTPAHPSSKAPTIKYWSHKEMSGKPLSDENAWRTSIGEVGKGIEFPSSEILEGE